MLLLERPSNHVIYRLSLSLGGSIHLGQMDHISSSDGSSHVFSALGNPLLAGPLERGCKVARGRCGLGKDRRWEAVQVSVDPSSNQHWVLGSHGVVRVGQRCDTIRI